MARGLSPGRDESKGGGRERQYARDDAEAAHNKEKAGSKVRAEVGKGGLLLGRQPKASAALGGAVTSSAQDLLAGRLARWMRLLRQ
jgi:hypothetical protein